ncbi:hypothetical protein J3F84DRAFT_249298 [Trichoderma pleuroticola]
MSKAFFLFFFSFLLLFVLDPLHQPSVAQRNVLLILSSCFPPPPPNILKLGCHPKPFLVWELPAAGIGVNSNAHHIRPNPSSLNPPSATANDIICIIKTDCSSNKPRPSRLCHARILTHAAADSSSATTHHPSLTSCCAVSRHPGCLCHL